MSALIGLTRTCVQGSKQHTITVHGKQALRFIAHALDVNELLELTVRINRNEKNYFFLKFRCSNY